MTQGQPLGSVRMKDAVLGGAAAVATLATSDHWRGVIVPGVFDGGAGPWASRQFQELPADQIVGPTNGLDPDPPSEVVDARDALDAATLDFEQADRAWRMAVHTAQLAQVNASNIDDWTGAPTSIDDASRTVSRLNRKAEDAHRARDKASERLKGACVAYREIATAWRQRVLADRLSG